MKRIALAVALLLIAGKPELVQAGALFEIELETDGERATRSFHTIEDLINTVKSTPNIQAILPSYTETSPLRAHLLVRGVPAEVRVDTRSNTFTLAIPAIGFTKTFSGASRTEAAKAMADFVKQNGDNVVGEMTRYAAQHTATDPVAGNPTSLQSLTVRNNFQQGFLQLVSLTPGGAPAPPPEPVPAGPALAVTQVSSANVVGVAGGYGNFKQRGFDYKTYSLPLSYTWRSDADPNKQIRFKLPVTMIEVERARSYTAGLGIAVTYPVAPNWLLTPSVDYGAVGSLDLGALSSLGSAGLTSAYRISLGKVMVHLGNQVSHLRTFKLAVGSYGADPRIQNTVFTNGAAVLVPLPQAFNVELFGAYTNFTGTKLFINNYYELGLSLGRSWTSVTTKSTMKENRLTTLITRSLRDLRLGLTYLHAQDGRSEGFTANAGFYF
jgi:hypothetical protein